METVAGDRNCQPFPINNSDSVCILLVVLTFAENMQAHP
jgi:hypothetical protein